MPTSVPRAPFSRTQPRLTQIPLWQLLLMIFVLLSCVISVAQQQPDAGVIPGFSTVESHEYDTVNLGTLAIELNVPVRSKAGHIPFSFHLAGASQISRIENVQGNNFSAQFMANITLVGQEAHAYGQASNTTTTSEVCQGHPDTGLGGWIYTDPAGTAHPVSGIGYLHQNANCTPNSGAGYTSDGSGLYVYVSLAGPGYVIDLNGNTITQAGLTTPSSFTDPNGNSISATTNNSGTTTYTDTFAELALTKSFSAGDETDTWTDSLSNNRSVAITNTQMTQMTSFGCGSVDQQTPAPNAMFTTSVALPDSSSVGLTWEKNYANSSYYTGRIASITLPTGGQISYAYSGGTNGINCIDATPATMTRTTPDGTWKYVHVPGGTTTVTDPQGNTVVHSFVYVAVPLLIWAPSTPFETEKQTYNQASTLIQTVFTCYNNPSSSPSNCNASPLKLPITEKDVYTTYPGVTGYSAVKTVYDTYGRVTDVKMYDFNASSQTNEKVINYGSGSPTSQSCTAISTYIIGKPCSVTLKDSAGNILSQTWNSYDGNGNLSQTWNLVSGSGSSGTYLSKQYTYDSHGVVQTMTDVNGQVTNYTTTSCNNMFVTSQYPTNFTNLMTSQTWDCNGGVVTSATDANSQTTHTNFYVGTTADPFYRPLQDVDELGNITGFSYGYTASSMGTTDSQFLFNGNASVIETLSTTDSIGRPVISQLRQGPSSASWETKSRTFDGDGRVYETSLTCIGAASAACSPSTESQTYDALNRPLVHTGTGGDIVTKTYPANDVLTTLTPAPTNENAKSVQKEYDGLGRLKSTCLISSAAGSGPCGQVNGETGFLTTYTYDGAGRLLQTIENAQVASPQQKRSYTYDHLGRVTSETNPEWASSSGYIYDSVSGSQACATPTGMTLGSNGDLIEKVDPNGNTTCYFYDGLHRNIAITYAGTNSNGVNKFFVYDAATVNGVAMTYAKGRLAEAYTCSGATLPCASKITDEGFSYENRGLLATYYQDSPNSGGWYTLAATYRGDGQLATVAGISLPTLTFDGLDGEGRVQSVLAGSGTNPVRGVAYNNGPGPDDSIGSVLTTTLGTGDTQTFTYDPYTGRMKSYSASVGSTPTVITGSLNWNANGTLQQLTINDGYNSADTQVCSYLYDDFVRVAGTTGSSPIPGVNCLNGSTKVWNQTFTYGSDGFGNITKSSTGPGASWACAACYNTATNHYNGVLSGTIAYDSDGNLTNDTFHTYTWLADGHVAKIDTNTITYDAHGNKVEENVGGTIHEYVSAFGVSAQMTGQTENATTVDLPGGVQALYSGGTLQRFRFPDWQGSIRAESNPTTRMFTESVAFAPFGERYVPMGAPFNVDSFTGKPDQIVNDEYDFPAREQHGGQGRWVSPDPMRGTGNKYVYADNNPLSKVDIFGLFVLQEQMDPSSQAFFDSEMNQGDPLLESHGPGSAQIGGIVAAGESAYLARVDSAFEGDVSLETPPVLQRQQADDSAKAGQGAQEAQNQKETVVFSDNANPQAYQEKPGVTADRTVDYQAAKMDKNGNIDSHDIERHADLTLHEKLDPNSKTKNVDIAGKPNTEKGIYKDYQEVPAGGSYRVLRDWKVDGNAARVLDLTTHKAFGYELTTLDANSKTPIKTEYTNVPPF